MKTTMRKSDELLDAALEMTFPASDPIAVDAPVRRRRKAVRGTLPRVRDKRSAKEHGGAVTSGVPRA
ncbi:MAG: hypothetical protein AB1761_05875 [Pseudomonadota bacterium]